jgi:hypothetical protein
MCTHCLFYGIGKKNSLNSTKYGAPMFFVSWRLIYIQGRFSTALLLHCHHAHPLFAATPLSLSILTHTGKANT